MPNENLILPLSPCLIDKKQTDKSTDNPAYAPVNTLLNAIKQEDIKNIAVSGNYGAGKSSVITTAMTALKNDYDSECTLIRSFRKVFTKKKVLYTNKYINVSLALLNTFSQTNTLTVSQDEIENSIVKQILYHDSPEITPKSRFQRLYKISYAQIFKIIAPLAIILISICILFEPQRLYIRTIATALEVDDNIKFWIDILALIALSISTCICFVYILNRFSLSIRKVVINKTEVGLAKSPFNRYLDEIVYFFEVTKYKIVTFEDLDRFENSAQIFYKLRELNQMLNNCKRISKTGKIIFIYAVRDDLFSNIDRVKYFDFIVSVIPVINSSNAYDKVIEAMGENDIKSIDGKQFMNLCEHFEDMRILRSIINDYNQFKSIVDFNLLSRKKLFGMIVYKNYCPEDFALMYNRHGVAANIINSKDKYHSEIYSELENSINANNDEIKIARKQEHDAIRKIKEQYVHEYRIHAQTINSAIDSILYGNSYTMFDKLAAKKDFDTYLQLDNLKFYSSTLKSRFSSVPKFSEIEKRVNSKNSYSALISSVSTEAKIKIYEEEIKILRDRQMHIPKNIAGILKMTLTSWEHEMESLAVEEKKNLLKYLLLNEYIDETYQLYISYFYPNSLTYQDRNFVIHASSKSKLNYSIPLNNIAAIIQRFSEEDFRKDMYLLNINIIKHLYANLQNINIRDAVIDNVVENKNIGFLAACYQSGSEIVPPRFYTDILQSWDAWNAILDYDDVECSHLREMYIRYCDVLSQRPNPEFLKWLSRNFGYIAEHFEYIGSDRLISIIEKFHLRFIQINVHSKISEALIRIVLDKLCFKLNGHNLESVMKYYNLFKKYTSASYTAILATKNINFIKYVETKLNYLLNKVFPKTSKVEEPHAILRILNNLNITDINCKKYISVQKHKIHSADQINKSRLKLAFENNFVKADWKNVDYYLSFENLGIPKHYLENNKFTVDINNEDETHKKRIKLLLLTNSLSIKAYKNIANKITEPLDYIDNTLHRTRLEHLVNANLLKLNVKNYSIVKAENMSIPFLLNNVKEYLSTSSLYNVGADEILAILGVLKSSQERSDYIKSISDINVMPNKNLASQICKLIYNKKLKTTDVNFQLLKESIALFNSPIIRINVAKKALLERKYDKNEALLILSAIGGEYKRLLTNTSYSQVSNTANNRFILKYLVGKGLFKSCKRNGNMIKVIK